MISGCAGSRVAGQRTTPVLHTPSAHTAESLHDTQRGAAVRPATISRDALASIHAERIDWRFKGMPAPSFGATIGEVAGRGLDLFADGFVGPLLVLDADAVEHNVGTM